MRVCFLVRIIRRGLARVVEGEGTGGCVAKQVSP